MVQTRDGYSGSAPRRPVRFDGHAFTVFDPGNTPGLSARITALSEGRNGIPWIGTESSLSRFEHERFTNHPIPSGARRYQDRRAVWVGSDGVKRRRRGADRS